MKKHYVVCLGIGLLLLLTNKGFGQECPINKGESFSQIVCYQEKFLEVQRKTNGKLDDVNINLGTLITAIKENTRAMVEAKNSIMQVNDTYMKNLQTSITRRFDNLPAEILNNSLFKEQIEKLKKEILDDLKKEMPDGQP